MRNGALFCFGRSRSGSLFRTLGVCDVVIRAVFGNGRGVEIIEIAMDI